jgi:hypothetical protein
MARTDSRARPCERLAQANQSARPARERQSLATVPACVYSQSSTITLLQSLASLAKETVPGTPLPNSALSPAQHRRSNKAITATPVRQYVLSATALLQSNALNATRTACGTSGSVYVLTHGI